MRKIKALFSMVLGASLLTSAALAEAPAAEINFPQQTLLAASGSLPNDVAIPLPSGMKMGQIPPITGGISRDGKGICSYTITNNFDKLVQVNLSIRQYNARLQRTSSSAASWRLKPAETQSKEVREQANTVGCALVLESWKFR